jgi:hypothetical protein
MQPNGFEITGTFAVNPINPEILVVSLDPDTIPQNTLIEQHDTILCLLREQLMR